MYFSRFYPALRLVLLFLLFVGIVFGLSSVLGYQTLGGYLAPTILLVLTAWLYHREGNSLAALGLTPARLAAGFIPLGLLNGVVFLSGALALQLFCTGGSVTQNNQVAPLSTFAGVFLLLQGVLNEELIFRGYLLQKTEQRLGILPANLLFAFLFMVWHWISWNAWGSPEVLFSSITTGFGHLLFSLALHRSGTLYFPIGLHLGINWASRFLFSQQPGSEQPDVWFLVTTPDPGPGFLPLLLNVALTLACYAVLMGLFTVMGGQRYGKDKRVPTE